MKTIRELAVMAPRNTANRDWFMAKIAATKKVLSPSSDMMIKEKAARNAYTWLTSINDESILLVNTNASNGFLPGY